MEDIEKKIVAFIVSLALFMDALDTTIINTAIPAMARSLHVYPVDLKIALISYLLSLAIFIPISGWFADKYGAKRVFLTALTIFTLCSLWCGYVQNLSELVVARSIQGIGGSFMMPVGRLILLRTFHRHEFVEAMSFVIMVVSIGLMLGPFAGGIITDYLSWHWIFWVNVPIGIATFIAAFFKLPYMAPISVKRLDIIGFILFGLGLAGFTFGLSDLSESYANQKTAAWILCIAIFLLIFYFLRANKKYHPVFKVDLFRYRTFQVSMLGNIFARLGFGGIPFLLPLLLQISLGYSARISGLLLVPVAIGIFIVKAIILKVLRMFGFKRLLLINTILVSLLLLAFCMITPAVPAYGIALLTFMFGFLISLQYSGMNSLAYAEVPNEELSAAISVVTTMQQVAQSMGVAVAALCLKLFSAINQQPFVLSIQVFHHTFFALSIITFCSTIIFLILKPHDGDQIIRSHKEPELA